MRVMGLNSIPNGPQGAGPAGADFRVDQILGLESNQIDSAKQRRDANLAKKGEFKNLGSLLDGLQTTTDQMKMPSSFRKLVVDTSNPEILTGEISGLAEPGSYELEVSTLARSDKHLAFGLPDKDKTPVGFGFMRIAVGEQMKDVIVEPGSTLKDVAQKINESLDGVRATIINTGVKDDPFRLMVTSKSSGNESLIEIDPDTTFTEFKNQTKGQDLALKFEGVDVKRSSNDLSDLIDGISLKASRAAPGTAITVNVRHDLDKTSEGLRNFVKQYNEIQTFSRNQLRVDGAQDRKVTLSGDGALRQVNRQLQSSLSASNLTGIGITTNPKTGELNLDESKLKEALTRDYDGVVKIFANSESGPGLASRLSDAIKSLQDRTSGAVATRVRGIEQRIKAQDQEISRQEERLAQRRVQVERTFASLDSKIATMQSQGQALSARFGAETSA